MIIAGLVFWWRGQPTFFFGSTYLTRSWNCGWSMCSCINSSCDPTSVPWNQGGKTSQIKYRLKHHFFFTYLFCLTLMFQSSTAQSIVTTVNVCVMLFIILGGGYLGFKSGWVGYELSTRWWVCLCLCIVELMIYSISFVILLKFLFYLRYFPYGVNGMFTGSAIVFFSYIGFDSVTSTAEEVNIPWENWPFKLCLISVSWN